MSQTYRINRVNAAPELTDWNHASWAAADELSAAVFYSEGSDHHPDTRAKIVYDAGGFYGIFMVKDRYVRCQPRKINDHVSEDSCVSFFFQPFGRQPYFSFEFNAGGVPSAYYIEDPTRIPHGFAKYAKLKNEELQQVIIAHSLPAVVEPEITTPQEWTVGFFIPFAILEKYCGQIDAGKLSGTSWLGNFYKCGDETSHPHWASWNPLGRLNFHTPKYFGELLFY